ncbi:conserved hypothetical protein [Methylocella tundrae]|uniref:Chorismate lyase n=1 Tax=Methylocella tundrae TaxID=227605 RepID=A0A8B6M094_METTU|nr:hypothetical protein [Methylocella tundrae]VTZ20945.1 conserved hypothetical protein [Methylocella tundrae]VTZ48461.1 conserved hypothetical protein [Methylocella tundrae]
MTRLNLSFLEHDLAARQRAFALLEALNARLLASHSATATLEQWCAETSDNFSAIRAKRICGADKPASREQRQRLQLGADEIVVYRRVELACGERVLSEAENWYVPSRLNADINRVLEDSDTPFGRAVTGLNPIRKTFAVEIFWRPDCGKPATASDRPGARPGIPERLFQHRALVYGEDGLPFSEVNETYTREILAFGPLAPSSR